MKKKNIFGLEALVLLLVFSGCLSTGIQPGASADTLILQSSENQFGALIKIVVVPKHDTEYEVRSVYWFSNWRDGWTEIVFPATGSLSIQRTEKDPPVVHVVTPLEIENPERAALRYQDTFLEDERALTQITNRWTRVTAACTWLIENGLGYEDAASLFSGVKDEDRPVKNYPAVPEEFEEILRTGTLGRDWQESPQLFRLALALPLTDVSVAEMKWKKEK